MPFEFNPQQPSKPTDKSNKSTFDFGQGAPAPKPSGGNIPGGPKPSGGKVPGGPKINIPSKPVSKSTSKQTPGKTNKSVSKTSASSSRTKRAGSKKNPIQNKNVMIFMGVGIAVLLLIFIAVASNIGGSDSTPQQTVQRKPTSEEIRKEKLRKLSAKYDAQYAAQQSGPKTEKQKLMTKAESKLRQGDYRGAADVYVKVHQLDPADGYPVTQLINIYRNKLHDKAQLEKWERVNNDIAQGSLDKLQKKSEEKYNKSKN